MEDKVLTSPTSVYARQTRFLSERFILWLFIISVTMFFAALTSAYMVKQGEADSQRIGLPSAFWLSTGFVLLSSVVIQWGYFMAKKNHIAGLKRALIVTAVLGIAFLLSQYRAWNHLIAQDVYLVGHPSGSFLYVMSGAHALHIVSAWLFLLVTIIRTWQHKVSSENRQTLIMCTTYWHFLGIVWLYLHIFFWLVNQ